MNAVSWRRAVRIAAEVEPIPATRIGLTSAVGSVLAQPIAAFTDLPPFDCAYADGYAVAGIGPWTLDREDPGAATEDLRDGQARAISAGSPLPPGCGAVLTHDRCLVEDGARYSHILVGDPVTGVQDARPGLIEFGSGIRRAKSAAEAGEVLVKAGAVVTSGTVAVAAAAGADDLMIIPPPTVAIIMRNEGLLSSGAPRRGKNRALVATMLPSWVMSSGARCLPEAECPDDAAAMADLIDAAGADLVIVTASANPESADIADVALRRLNAEILISELACEPGGRVTLAELRDGRRVMCLPNEPAEAVVALSCLLTPALTSLSGRPRSSDLETAMLLRGVGEPGIERAVPVIVEHGELADLADPQPWSGPHDISPLGTADGIAFIDADRGAAQESVPVMPLPGR